MSTSVPWSSLQRSVACLFCSGPGSGGAAGALLQCSAVLINSSSGFEQNPTIYQRSMEKNLSVGKKKIFLLLQGSVPMCSVDKKGVEVCVCSVPAGWSNRGGGGGGEGGERGSLAANCFHWHPLWEHADRRESFWDRKRCIIWTGWHAHRAICVHAAMGPRYIRFVNLRLISRSAPSSCCCGYSDARILGICLDEWVTGSVNRQM